MSYVEFFIRMIRTCSLILLVAAGTLCAIPRVTAAQEFITLDDFNDQLPQLGHFDQSIVGFLSAVERFSFASILGGTTATGVPEFRTFTDEARSALDAVPVPSGSTSVAYTFDPKLETFVRWERPMSPAISQNARTNGRRVLAFGVSYSYIDYQKFDDFDHDNVIVSAGDFGTAGVIQDILYFNFKLRQQVYGFSAQFGVLDNLDLGIFIPVIDLDFRGKAIDQPFVLIQPATGSFLVPLFASPRAIPSVSDIKQSDFFGLPYPGIRFSKNETGIGDLILRAKYYIGSTGPLDFGTSLNSSLPTGDQDNLFGVGSVRFDPRILISTATPAFAMHINGGYHADVDNGDRDRVDYGAGGEVQVTRWMSLLVDQVGRVGVRGDPQVRKFEIIPGVKINPYGGMVVGFNAIVPLNREGLTTDWTPNGVVDASFVF